MEDYARQQRTELQAQLKEAASDEEKAAIRAKISEINNEERIMNILIGAVAGMGNSALLKESLSAAAEEMRDYTIKDSQKFKGITDGTTVLTNTSGESEGIRQDGTKTGGTRADLDNICGEMNERCKVQKNPDGTNILDTNGNTVLELDNNGRVQFDVVEVGMSLAEYLESTKGQEAAGATGGIQGWKGTLFGRPYAAGSWQDKLIESFGGSHDFSGGTLTGLYDEQGNIKRGMSDSERFMYDKLLTTTAIPIAAPFAAAELLPPEVWKGIAIFLGAAR